jgi:hypothetical protein
MNLPAAATGPSASRRGRDRPATPRLLRELRTLAAMTAIYCREQHGCSDGLCADCAELLRCAAKRLAGCPYGEGKPVCARCLIHFYGPAPRAAVRTVMRYAGPKMLLRHPLLALRHVLDKGRPAPPKPRGRSTG